jgi:hypothetical protein
MMKADRGVAYSAIMEVDRGVDCSGMHDERLWHCRNAHAPSSTAGGGGSPKMNEKRARSISKAVPLQLSPYENNVYFASLARISAWNYYMHSWFPA